MRNNKMNGNKLNNIFTIAYSREEANEIGYCFGFIA